MTTENPDRRRLMQLSLASIPALLPFVAAGSAFAAVTKVTDGGTSAGPARDFDFFLGSWRVEHRRLKKRLAGSSEWEEFDGTSKCISLLGGIANMNDSVTNRPGGVSRGMGLRAYDAASGNWADWYLDGRNPVRIDVPGIGRFVNGVGTFLSDDTFEGKPIKVRGIFSRITSDSHQWEQAFSPDGGKSWETNWVMRHTRTSAV